MNEVFGMLIPLLMKGASIGDILKVFASLGTDRGAASIDGLTEMLSTQMAKIRREYPVIQDPKTISRAAESLIDQAGVVPTSGFGQAMASGMSALYSLFPDVMGGIMGIPNSKRFFGTIANGSSTISAAAGFGSPDIFNPYSVMEAHRRTLNMANRVYELGTNKGGGYNVEFSHGLNMEEMGLVSQRLLSSALPYRGYEDERRKTGVYFPDKETGEILNPENQNQAGRFKRNIEALGSKFNEAASMLAKITGSVEKALSLMDRMAGGNFLGGSVKQAVAVADRARNMAAAIRVTAAMAGISPTEAYQRMAQAQLDMSAGMGLNEAVAVGSGFADAMMGMANAGVMGYNMWAAMHADAPQPVKDRMMMVSQARAHAYSQSSAARLAAAVVANSEVFSDKQLSQIRTAYREGRAKDVYNMVRGTIGTDRLDAMMSDPATIVATRMKATQKNRRLLEDMDVSGMEGNYVEAERYGTRIRLKKTMSDLDNDLLDTTGKASFYRERDDAKKDYLKSIAKERLGLTDEGMKDMSTPALMAMLREVTSVDVEELERGSNMVEISKAKEQIKTTTLTEGEENTARDKLKRAIQESRRFDESKKRALLTRIGKGEDLYEINKDFTAGMGRLDRLHHDREVFGGKMTKSQADMEYKRLSELERLHSEYTAEERIGAIRNGVAMSKMMGAGELTGIYTDKNFKTKTDLLALAEFAEKVNKLDESGAVNIKYEGLTTDSKENLEKTYAEASERMLKDEHVLGDSLGNMKGGAFGRFVAEKSKEMLNLVRGGNTFAEAFAKAFEEKRLTGRQKRAIGEAGLKYLRTLTEDAQDKDSPLRTKYLDKTAFFSAASGVINERTMDERQNAVSDLEKLVSGDLGRVRGGEKGATSSFIRMARHIGLVGWGEKDGPELQRKGIEEYLRSTYGSDMTEEARGNVAKEAMRLFNESRGRGSNSYSEAIRLAAKKNNVAIDEGRLTNAGAGIMQGMLKVVQPKGIRTDGYSAAIAAEEANGAAVNWSAAEFVKTGGGMIPANFRADVVAAVDDINADASQNRITNALSGNAAYYKEAIKQTKAKIADLGRVLTKAGIKDTDVKALDDQDESRRQEAETKVMGALRGRIDSKFEMGMLKTIGSGGRKIGGRDAVEVLFGGERAMSMAMRGKGAGEDVLDITRESNRRDSDLAQIVEKISELASIIGRYSTGDNSIKVSVTNGFGLGSAWGLNQ